MSHNTDQPIKFSLEIPVTQTHISAIDCLATACAEAYPSLSRQALKNAMAKGAVWLQQNQKPGRQGKSKVQRLRRAKRVLAEGDTLYLYYNEAVLQQTVNDAVPVYVDTAYSVWNKPSGMPSQGSKWGDHTALNRWVEQQQQRTCFLIHRLDKAASGLILLAHDKKTAAQLCQYFEDRKITKRYQAIVHGKFPEQEQVFENNIDGKTARTRAKRLDYDFNHQCSLLSIDIDTGRKHQIRRHLSEARFPIVGDRLYGQQEARTEEDELHDLQLRAWQLAFECPITQAPRSYTLPEDQRLSFSIW